MDRVKDSQGQPQQLLLNFTHHDTPVNQQLLVLCFPARAQKLGEIRSHVSQTLSQSGCSIEVTDDVVLAIDEACQNIIRHAYGKECEDEIVLQISRQRDSLTITLRDYALPVGSECMKPRDLDDIRPGGLGCHFIQHVMDEVSIGSAPEGKGNLLQMVKRLT